jgi:lipopolysaccharide export LptBFGC system permease protein LptF
VLGIGVAFLAFEVFGVGESWQEKKIREIMNKEKIKTMETFDEDDIQYQKAKDR